MLCRGESLYTFTKDRVHRLLTYDLKDRSLYSMEDYLRVLLTASLLNGFAEGVSNSLIHVPSGDTILSYLKSQNISQLQIVFDQMIEQNILSLRKKRKLVNKIGLGIDWHDVMYYGDPKTPMVLGTQHKNGSNYAFEYLTASILLDGERFIIGVMPISARKDVSTIVKRLLERVQELGIKIRYVTMDGGFFSIDILQELKQKKINYIIRMPSNSKTKKMRLWKSRRFQYKKNNHSRSEKKQASFEVVVAYDEEKKYKYLFATNLHYCSKTILKLFKKRWGIETSYRMCNQFLIKTTSKNYTVRLFYYLFACSLYNTWIKYNQKEPIKTITMKIKLLQQLINPKEDPKKTNRNYCEGRGIKSAIGSIRA